jgi:hypothetical protein
LVAEGEAGRDPLTRQLYFVWRMREYEHECLTRARLSDFFRRGPRGEQEQE